MTKIIRVAQKLLLFNSKNQVLILQASTNNGKTPKKFVNKWDLPGGGLKSGETLTQSLKREIREELGEINYLKKEIIDVIEFDYQSHDGNSYQTICLIYKANFNNGKIKISSEHQKYEWIDLKDILNPNYKWEKSNINLFKKIQTNL